MAKPKTQQQELPLPQPQCGGSYIRKPDGSLELVERTEDPQPAPAGNDAAPEEQAP